MARGCAKAAQRLERRLGRPLTSHCFDPTQPQDIITGLESLEAAQRIVPSSFPQMRATLHALY
jgi:hypothetical protein